MKTLITIILTALLAACGSGDIEATVKSDKAVAQPAVIVAEPEPVPATPVSPTPPICDLTTYIPCAPNPAPPPAPTAACTPGAVGCEPPEGMELCDIWSYIPCQYPTWILKQPK